MLNQSDAHISNQSFFNKKKFCFFSIEFFSLNEFHRHEIELFVKKKKIMC
jgi:hypothetical protein